MAGVGGPGLLGPGLLMIMVLSFRSPWLGHRGQSRCLRLHCLSPVEFHCLTHYSFTSMSSVFLHFHSFIVILVFNRVSNKLWKQDSSRFPAVSSRPRYFKSIFNTVYTVTVDAIFPVTSRCHGKHRIHIYDNRCIISIATNAIAPWNFQRTRQNSSRIPGFPAEKNSSKFPGYPWFPGVLDTLFNFY